jgi:xanthosine utilization system XapX-like protein
MFATLLIFAIMAPAAYAQSSYPDGRVLVDAAFIMIIMTIIEGMLTGIIFSQLHQRVNDPVPEYLQVITGCILIIILFYPLYDARKNILQIPEFSAQASSWDARDARIRAAHNLGKVDIQEKGLNAPGGLAEMREDPSDWVNVCATWFYDVNSISVGNP